MTLLGGFMLSMLEDGGRNKVGKHGFDYPNKECRISSEKKEGDCQILKCLSV